MIAPPPTYLPLLQRIHAILAAQGVTAYLAGGTPRDLLLGRPLHDLDLLVADDGVALARALADALGGAFVALDTARGTGRVVLDAAQHVSDEAPGQLFVDVARQRAPTIEDDLRLRDFTANALAVPLAVLAQQGTLQVIDPCGGQNDIAARVLRVCGPRAFEDDPLRMLRLVRLATKLGFAIDPVADMLLRRSVTRIANVSSERVRDELLQMLDGVGGAWGLRYLDDARLLTRIFPELEPARNCDQPNVHVMPVLPHSLEAVTAMEWLHLQIGVYDTPNANPLPYEPLPLSVQTHPDLQCELPYPERLRELLRGELAVGHRRAALHKLATLLHDNAKPQTKAFKDDGGISFHDHQVIGGEVAGEIGRRLRLSRPEVAYASTVVREHMRPGQLMQIPELTLRAVNRFFRDCGDAGPDVLLHSFADHMATRGYLISPSGWRAHVAWTGELLRTQYEQPEEPAPLLDGQTIMRELRVPQGPLVGRLLRAVREAQLAGEIASPAEALAVAQNVLATMD